MPDNLEYFYQNIPTRFRREDKELFLKRYLQFFGETLDFYDELFDTFFENINPDTATAEWIEFWLENLFGWSWFPTWFTLAQKRTLYRNFARHLARRGTADGIEAWLADFNIKAKVYTKPAFYGEWAWGEGNVFVAEPLLIVIEILSAEPNYPMDMCGIGDGAYGEQFCTNYEPLFTTKELNALLFYVQPHAQEILIMPRRNWNAQQIGFENYLFRSN